MQRIFDVDNPLWRFAGKLVDLTILTVIWVVCCLPIITIGAATTALYYVTMKMATDSEGYIYHDFFKSMKMNFKQSTVVWLVLLSMTVVLATSIWWYYQIAMPIGAVMITVLLVVSVLCLMLAVYVFPLLARCEVSYRQLFSMALILSVKNVGWTLFMIVCLVCMLAIGIFLAAPVLVFGAGLVAYIHGKVLKIVFEPYHLNLA